ncbi:MAG TPA: tail fiber protein [Solirubrobacter sp.]|nr:tail fiber protein [Solirubrobacter sp.]
MADSTSRLALPYPELEDQADISEAVQPLAEALDNAVLITAGTILPGSASPAGKMFLNTSSLVLYVATGSIWVPIISGGGVSPIGAIEAYAGSTDPVDQDGVSRWLICDGRALSRSTYATLFSRVGTTYGTGDGTTTFNLPDLRGRVVVGVDGAAARLDADDTLGASGGAQKHQLTRAQMPTHRHGIPVQSQSMPPGPFAAFVTGLRGSALPLPGSPVTSTSFGPVPAPEWGGEEGMLVPDATTDQPHNNMQPYQVANWIIRVR